MSLVFLTLSLSLVQKLKKYREKSTGRSSPPTANCQSDGGAVEDKGMAAILAQDKAMAERKELAQKQKERALAQMQSMQRKFLEKNREQLLNLETSVDEPYALCLLLSPHSFSPPLFLSYSPYVLLSFQNLLKCCYN